ncbi:MAG: HAD-IC family P-type ATPase, partial [Clostridiales bacterium]|nr:HAD-IC family P-type ATPase [Clostridiales bacterium]
MLSIIIGAILLAAAVIVTKTVLKGPTWAVLLIFLVPYLWLGYKVLFDAVHGLVSGSFMDENFLMSVASIGALCIGEHTEAVLVMLLYCIGEFLEELAIGRSRSSIAALTDIRPDRANLEKNGEIIETDCEKVHVGDIILVRAGERIPLDGIVIEGSSGLNTSALTGESLPRDVTFGDEVLSGCINISGTLRIKTVKEACDSTASRILELIEGASANKSKSEGFITKFAKWYTPAVIVIVILLAVIPPLFFNQSWSDWVYNALNILVISCPCALVISVPLTFFGGIGAASRKGILVKGSNYLETLSKCSTMVFDKTGTLTKGTFKIKRINAVGVSEEELLTLTAACERFSTHPLAQSILAYCGNRELPELSGNEELAGLGVRGTIDGH